MPDIKHSIQIAAEPEVVYPLAASAKGIGEWWATDIMEPQETVDLGFFNRATVYRLRLIVKNAPTHESIRFRGLGGFLNRLFFGSWPEVWIPVPKDVLPVWPKYPN